MKDAVQNRLAADISHWHAEGWITPEALATLKERYDVKSTGLAVFVRYAGVMGVLFAASGIAGVIAMVADSFVLNVLFLSAAAAAAMGAGIRLCMDPLNRYPAGARTLLVAGYLCALGALTAVGGKLGEEGALVLLGLVGVPLAIGLAYLFRSPLLLLCGMLVLFHWMGSWNRMVGRSTYEFSLQDPKVMTIAALLIVGLGMAHRRFWAERYVDFWKVYQVTGLIYCNMSLLILSIYYRYSETSGDYVIWLVLFTAVCLGQIVLGAYIRDKMITGFGITFFMINLFTRYFEQAWDKLSKDLFFVAGGLVLLLAGAAIEWYLGGRSLETRKA